MTTQEYIDALENPQLDSLWLEETNLFLKGSTVYNERQILELKPKRANMGINIILAILALAIINKTSLVSITISALIVVLIVYLNKRAKNKVLKSIEENERQMEEYVKESEILKEKVNKILPFLQKDYCTCSAVKSLASYFKSGRADTLKEALNLYESELALQKQQETINELQSQLNDVQKAAKNAETASTVSAVGSAINLFK